MDALTLDLFPAIKTDDGLSILETLLGSRKAAERMYAKSGGSLSKLVCNAKTDSLMEAPAIYGADESRIRAAVALVRQAAVERLASMGAAINGPEAASDFLIQHFAGYEREAFVVVFLTNPHQVIAAEEMFTGTADKAAVYPREVVKRALHHNAAAIIIAHNHPGGDCAASVADQSITNKLRTALEIVDVRILDHFIVAGDKTKSFAELGLL